MTRAKYKGLGTYKVHTDENNIDLGTRGVSEARAPHAQQTTFTMSTKFVAGQA